MGLEAASRARSRASFAAPARSRPARPGRPVALLLGLVASGAAACGGESDAATKARASRAGGPASTAVVCLFERGRPGLAGPLRTIVLPPFEWNWKSSEAVLTFGQDGKCVGFRVDLETDPFPGARGDYLKTLGERFGQPTLEGDDRIFRAGEHAVRVKVHEDRIAVHVGTATR